MCGVLAPVDFSTVPTNGTVAPSAVEGTSSSTSCAVATEGTDTEKRKSLNIFFLLVIISKVNFVLTITQGTINL